MKKLSLFLGALLIVGTTVSAKEVIAEPMEMQEPVMMEPMVEAPAAEVMLPQWKFGARMYLETEDFDSGSKLTNVNDGSKNSIRDDEDGTFIGTGVSATKGKLTLDLNVERRLGGDLSLSKGDQEWEATRVDWKVRYQLFEKQAFHLKYRNEEKTRDWNKKTYHKDSTRDRYELGTDWNHFDGLFAGWFVVGHDEDQVTDGNRITSKSSGNYYEGDFGPIFKLTETVSLNPTLYVTGENYGGKDAYRMDDYQARLMLIWKATDKVTIMPRIRYNIEKTQRNNLKKDVWTLDAGDRIRYELMANVQIKDNLSSFVGVAFDDQTRNQIDANGNTVAKDGIDMWWTYVGLNYSF
ncbi:MAG: hypothetical protein ACRC0S_03745 [Fusobacteriaceae bacterium]